MKIKECNISILIIGPINKNNLVSVSRNCRHWRLNFPSSKIILSISSSDIDNIDNISVNSILGKAASNIKKACDVITYCEFQMPLPPIKNDSNFPNNINLMISSSKHGLNFVDSEYVLRIRSDAIFFSKKFIDFYEKRFLLPRSENSILKQRVLIPQLYTLNPFSYERLPLHFGDWFHFGLAEDVRTIWDIPYMELADAEYYKYNKHNIISNSSERKFYTKLAVEQYIIYNSLKKKNNNLNIEYHNDINAIKESIDILLDEFIICDLSDTHFHLEKYKASIRSEEKEMHCLNSEVWEFLCHNRNEDYRSAILSGFEKARKKEKKTYIPLDFNLVFDCMNLFIKNGSVENANIVSYIKNGLISYGPYIDLEAGDYEVCIHINEIHGFGFCLVHCTADCQRITLCKKYIFPFRGKKKVKFLLKINKNQKEIEFLVKSRYIKYISYSKITIKIINNK